MPRRDAGSSGDGRRFPRAFVMLLFRRCQASAADWRRRRALVVSGVAREEARGRFLELSFSAIGRSGQHVVSPRIARRRCHHGRFLGLGPLHMGVTNFHYRAVIASSPQGGLSRATIRRYSAPLSAGISRLSRFSRKSLWRRFSR